MYKEYSGVKIPDSNVMIWRYMDFAKFVSILERKSLFFVSVDKLYDKLEGFYPIPNVIEMLSDHDKLPEDFWKKFELAYSKYRRRCSVNCWHINNYESAAMWGIYTKENKGIALKSSFERLQNSFEPCPENIGIGMVKYIDHKNEGIEERNTLAHILWKSKSYEYEHELRAFFYDTPKDMIGKGWEFELNKPIKEIGLLEMFDGHPGLFDENLGGKYINVCLDDLIDEIRISPGSPKWFKELVESIVKKYALSKNVEQSSLDDEYNLY